MNARAEVRTRPREWHDVTRARINAILGALLSVLLGGASGYLSWKVSEVHGLLTPEIMFLVINPATAAFVTDLSGSLTVTKHVLEGALISLQVLPGALAFGMAMGLAVRRVEHKRLLLCSVLAWPIFGWVIYRVPAVAGLLTYSLVFAVVLVVYLITKYADPLATPTQQARQSLS